VIIQDYIAFLNLKLKRIKWRYY